jgi:hypothetical protein
MTVNIESSVMFGIPSTVALVMQLLMLSDATTTLRFPMYPLPLDERRRTRQLRGLMGDDLPLFIGTGTHYINAFIGTPPQRASLIVDTGSEKMALPCHDCTNCGQHTDPPFDDSKSSTGHRVTCTEGCNSQISYCSGTYCKSSQSYMEGSSWSAVNVKDQVWLGSPFDATVHASSPAAEHSRSLAVEFEFGCQYSNSGMFTNQVSNGIIGFSRGSNTFVNKLFAEGKIAEHIFGFCFSYTGGEMLLGAPAGELQEPIKWAALIHSNSGWYRVHVVSVHIGSAALSASTIASINSGSGAIVDCGTTDTYLPSSTQAVLSDEFRKAGHGMGYSPRYY